MTVDDRVRIELESLRTGIGLESPEQEIRDTASKVLFILIVQTSNSYIEVAELLIIIAMRVNDKQLTGDEVYEAFNHEEIDGTDEDAYISYLKKVLRYIRLL